MTQKFWEFLIEVLAVPELGTDSRFATMRERTAHRDELTPLLDEAFGRNTTEYWIGQLQTKVPVAPVFDLPQALDNPFVQQINMIQTMPHRVAGELRALRNPIKLGGERLPGTPGHGLGADNEAVLGDELGLGDRLAGLKRDGVV